MVAMHDPTSLPPPPDGPGLWQTWGRLPVLGLALFLVASNIIGQALVFALGGGLAAPVIAGGLFGVLMPLEVLRRRGVLHPRADLGLDRPRAATLALVVVIALAGLAPTSGLAELSLRVHPVDPAWAAFYDEHLARTPAALVLTVLAVVLVAPLVEEILFRALVQRLAAETWGRGAGLAVGAIVFGLVHGESWYLFGLIGVGLMLGLVWDATRSLTAAWLAHALHNAVSLYALWSDGGIAVEPSRYGTGDWILLGVSCAVLAVAVPLLRRAGRLRTG